MPGRCTTCSRRWWPRSRSPIRGTVKLISAARVKTDTRDTLHLARLLAANLIPTVWVPPPPVRELRALVAHRERLVRQRTQAKNRLQSLLQSHNLAPPEHEAGWQQLPLAPLDRFRLQQDRLLVEQLGELIRQVDAELTRLSVEEPWASPMVYLMQLPGLGIITSMTILAAIGEITRFPSPQKLVGYSGPGASVHASGQTFQTGAITKQGRRELRTALHRIRLDCRAPPSLLASPIRAAGCTQGRRQSHCGHCP